MSAPENSPIGLRLRGDRPENRSVLRGKPHEPPVAVQRLSDRRTFCGADSPEGGVIPTVSKAPMSHAVPTGVLTVADSPVSTSGSPAPGEVVRRGVPELNPRGD